MDKRTRCFAAALGMAGLAASAGSAQEGWRDRIGCYRTSYDDVFALDSVAAGPDYLGLTRRGERSARFLAGSVGPHRVRWRMSATGDSLYLVRDLGLSGSVYSFLVRGDSLQGSAAYIWDLESPAPGIPPAPVPISAWREPCPHGTRD